MEIGSNKGALSLTVRVPLPARSLQVLCVAGAAVVRSVRPQVCWGPDTVFDNRLITRRVESHVNGDF